MHKAVGKRTDLIHPSVQAHVAAAHRPGKGRETQIAVSVTGHMVQQMSPENQNANSRALRESPKKGWGGAQGKAGGNTSS